VTAHVTVPGRFKPLLRRCEIVVGVADAAARVVERLREAIDIAGFTALQ
jgi:hypothetical protein